MKLIVKKKTNSPRGFTLIELIVVFSVIAILSTAGLAAFVSYSRQQTINTTTQEIKTAIFNARSRAGSQVSLCPAGQQFYGYLVVFCPKSDTCAACDSSVISGGYQLDIRCGNSSVTSDTLVQGTAKPYPSNITVTADSHNLLFNPITGTVNPQCDGLSLTSWNVSVSGYGKPAQTISVFNTGIIK
jgi:prepilin-type N-terminal cleavage/methylation domain-containing protein